MCAPLPGSFFIITCNTQGFALGYSVAAPSNMRVKLRVRFNECRNETGFIICDLSLVI
jgi:hypothetical protein